MAKIHEYTGKAVLVTYDARRCIHAAECVQGLPNVFDPAARPWVAPDAAEADEIAAVVARCPTGALHLSRKDGGGVEPVPAENSISVAADGPLYVRGDVEIVGLQGTVLLQDTRVALCRCGASSHKPLCDGSHADAGFRDAGEISGPRLSGDAESTGKLKVTVAADGPLVLDGPVSLAGATGGSCRGSRGALCRCGQSAGKPFCDGTHSRIGFRDG